MKPVVIAPVVALALAAGGAGAYFWLASGGSVEEAAVAQPTPTAESTATATHTATPAPTAEPGGWATYRDPELGFSFPLPAALTVSEESVDLFGKDSDPAVSMRSLTFRDSAGVRALDLGIAPNPDELTVQEWIDTYDPCASSADSDLPQPERITIAGQSGILCPIDQLMQPNPRVYFESRDWQVFVLVGNVNGIPESGFPPALSEAEFQRVVDGFSFDGL